MKAPQPRRAQLPSAGPGLLVLAELVLAGLFAAPATGLPLPDVLGEIRTVTVAPGDTLVDLAYAHRVGFEALVRLNPDVKVWIPEPGAEVQLPTRVILPDAPPVGLVINIAEMRLYDFSVGRVPEVFAVAVGDADDPTPVGAFRVGGKERHPHWRVPAAIRSKRPELPPIVPPGPSNPLGSRWMTIGASSYGIHGTDLPWSIGRHATHGCIRLFDDEMERLFERVEPGTPLRIVYQSVKLGRRGNTLYLEVHPDSYGREADRRAELRERLRALEVLYAVDPALLERELSAQRGVPIAVAELPAAIDVHAREAR